MTTLRTLEEFGKAYFATHPDEIDSWIVEAYAEFREDHDREALQACLRLIEKFRQIK